MPVTAQIQKCKRLEIATTQKVLAVKADAGPHLSLAPHSNAHRDRGSVLALHPLSTKYTLLGSPVRLLQPCSKSANIQDSSHTETASLES